MEKEKKFLGIFSYNTTPINTPFNIPNPYVYQLKSTKEEDAIEEARDYRSKLEEKIRSFNGIERCNITSITIVKVLHEER